MKKSILLIFIILVTNNLYCQDKKNKIEIGANVTSMFDYRGTLHNFDNFGYPLIFFNTISYSRKIKNSSIEWQFRLIDFQPKNRDIEYNELTITNKGYDEHFTYFTFLFLNPLLKNKALNLSLSTGIQYRWGTEQYYVTVGGSGFDSHTGSRISNDISVSAGFNVRSVSVYCCYLYIHPQYNFYFYQSKDVFKRSELQLNFGMGYSF